MANIELKHIWSAPETGRTVCLECGLSSSMTSEFCTGKIEMPSLLDSAIDHPSHYGGKDNPYEAIKVIEAWGLGFCLGNTIKYIARANKKGDELQDLKKARWYLNREISNIENINE